MFLEDIWLNSKFGNKDASARIRIADNGAVEVYSVEKKILKKVSKRLQEKYPLQPMSLKRPSRKELQRLMEKTDFEKYLKKLPPALPPARKKKK